MFTFNKLIDPEWYFRKYVSLISKFASKKYVDNLLLVHRIKLVYQHSFHKKLHLHHPKSLNEKLLWLSLYWKHPLKAECADKVKVRDYVRAKGLEHILTPVIGIFESPNDIPFEQLPSRFVLKCNHGCAYNVIVKDKDSLDIPATISQLSKWMSETYGEGTSELHYRDIRPHLIICEEYLCSDVQEEMTDYKIHCINGVPEYVQVCYDRDEKGIAHRASYSLNWQPLHYFKEPECVVERPVSLDRMVEYATILSKDFPYVRVDFYDVKGVPVLSELTFTPFGNMIYWVKDEIMDELGHKLVLPPKYLN